MGRTLTIATVALAGAALLAGCSNDQTSGTTTGTGTGHVSIMMTDAPSATVQTAVVTISKVYLVGSAADTANTSAQVQLLAAPVTTDLLTLANDLTTLVDTAAVKAGTYQQLRFVIDGAYIQTVDSAGTTHTYATAGYANAPATVDGTLKCPSCSQSGIKVNLPDGGLTVTEGETTSLLVDFNVADTFGHQAGNSGMWVMHPTLNATQASLAGQLHVTLGLADSVTLPVLDTVTTTLGSFSAELKPSDADSTSTGTIVPFVSSNGTFAADFSHLVPGSYTVTIMGPTGLTFTTDPETQAVTVQSGATASAAFTVTSAVAAGGG